jgi:DNA-binding NarL/FixJ family response regulator
VNLTPRHWELLRLVAASHTNAQIARRLDVTE